MRGWTLRSPGAVLVPALLLGAVVFFAACTFVNKATFAIEPLQPAAAEEILRGIEDYFATLGIKLEQKTEFIYPESRKESSYFLGRRRGPWPLHSSYEHVVLRLEQSGRLYIDWIEISDVRKSPRPGPFAPNHAKIAGDLRSRLGVEVVFRFVEHE